MLRKSASILCWLVISADFLIAQITLKNGVKYVDYVVVRFSVPIYTLRDSHAVYDVSEIRPEFSAIREYVEQFGPVTIKQLFPGSAWGDTVRTVVHGKTERRVTVPQLAEFVKIYFLNPVPESHFLAGLKLFPHVKSASGPRLIRYQNDPNDPRRSEQWSLWTVSAIQSFGAWEITTGGRTLYGGQPHSIALMDEGVALHEDLNSKIRGGEPGITGFHGTKIAGCMAAATNNGIGIAGMGWQTMITPFHDVEGSEIEVDIRNAADLAYVKVINMSLLDICIDEPSGNLCRPCNEVEAEALLASLNYAALHGKVLVAAGGNSPASHLPCGNGIHSGWTIPYPAYPAYHTDVISVSPTTPSDEFAEGFNYDYGGEFNQVELSAPGIEILTTIATSPYYELGSGSSYSSALVAAVAALILDINPSLTVTDVRTYLHNGAIDRGPPGPDVYHGFGRVDAYNSVKLAIPNSWSGALLQDPPTQIPGGNFVNTALLLKNPDHVAYPFVHAQCTGNVSLDNSTLVLEKRFRQEMNGYSLSLANGSRVVQEPESEIRVDPQTIVSIDNTSTFSFQGPSDLSPDFRT